MTAKSPHTASTCHFNPRAIRQMVETTAGKAEIIRRVRTHMSSCVCARDRVRENYDGRSAHEYEDLGRCDVKIPLREPLIPGLSRCEAAFGAPQHADQRGTQEVVQRSRFNQSRAFFISTGRKVFLTFGGVNMCAFLWRRDCARCLEFARITW